MKVKPITVHTQNLAVKVWSLTQGWGSNQRQNKTNLKCKNFKNWHLFMNCLIIAAHSNYL